MMTNNKELEIQLIKNRIALLQSRDEPNGNIINKLQRKLRKLLN